MTDPNMPDRTAPAANADILGDEARNEGKTDGLSEDVRPDGSRGDRGNAQPGKDINQAGFLKDEDSKDKPGG